MKNIICIGFLFLSINSFCQKIYSVKYASQSDFKVFVVDYECSIVSTTRPLRRNVGFLPSRDLTNFTNCMIFSITKFISQDIWKKTQEKNNYKVHKKLNQSDPDEDFIYMCNSKNFLKSGGGFSNLVNKMVEMNGNNVFNQST